MARPPYPGIEVTDPRAVRALAHPLRRALLSALIDHPASPKELAPILKATIYLVSYHVRVLHRLGLIRLVERIQRRGVYEHVYEAIGPTYISDRTVKKLPLGVRRALYGAWLETIRGELDRGHGSDEPHLVRVRLRLDRRGRAALGRAISRFEKALAAAERQSLARNKRLDLPLARVVVIALGGDPEGNISGTKRARPTTAQRTTRARKDRA